MDTTISTTRRKIIDIPEDVFRYLSIKAASNGTNLKRYIENLLKKDVEDMDDNAAYAYLSKEKPDGHIMVGKEEKKTLRNGLTLNLNEGRIFKESIYRIRIGSYRAFFVFHVEIIEDTVKFEYLISRGEAYDKKNMKRLRGKD